jgi:hypothetical protein
MKIVVMALLFPVVLFSQSNQYLFLQTEVDARNMIFGGTVNERGYNGFLRQDLLPSGSAQMLFMKLSLRWIIKQEA